MARLVDNLIAFKILKMLVTPFDQTDAYNLGIVDAQGKTIRKSSTLTTNAEKDSYNYLTRLVFGLKKIINKLPGGESKFKSLVAALWLVKEQYQTNGKLTNALLEERFNDLLKMMDNKVSLVEEEIFVKKFLSEDAPANATGAAVSTDQPKIDPKAAKKYKQGNMSLASMVRRPKPVGIK